MTELGTISHDSDGVLDDQAVRRIVNEFSVTRAEGPHQDFIRRLARLWHEFNEAHFEGRLSPAYIAISEPKSPRADGDCSAYSGHGGRLQIRLRPSHVAGTVNQGKAPLPGKTLRFMRPGHGLQYRERHLADILLHEMGHQYEMEMLGTKGGHGKDFCAICNRIGAVLGLPPVVVRRRKGDPRSLPICAQWPHNVRPADYYGDLWDQITGPAEEGEDLVLRLVALFASLEELDKLRFLTHPIVAAIIVTVCARLSRRRTLRTHGGRSGVRQPAPILMVAQSIPRRSKLRGSRAVGRSRSLPSRLELISRRSARSKPASSLAGL
jgi:hypothetical protein